MANGFQHAVMIVPQEEARNDHPMAQNWD
jgi:hypothetical protein